MRQITRFRPAGHMEEIFRITSGLAPDARLSARGLPRLLDAAVLVWQYRDDMVLASPPQAVQLMVLGALAPVGRLVGKGRLNASYFADPHALATS